MSGAIRAAQGVLCRGQGNLKRDLAKRVLASIRIVWRVCAILLQGPTQNAFLLEASVLQMLDPGKKSGLAFDNRAQALIGIFPVTGNARKELRDQTRMVELFLFGRAEIGFWAGHPEQVAMNNDFLLAQ